MSGTRTSGEGNAADQDAATFDAGSPSATVPDADQDATTFEVGNLSANDPVALHDAATFPLACTWTTGAAAALHEAATFPEAGTTVSTPEEAAVKLA